MVNDLDEARRIVQDSGNNFHARVLRFLKKEGWTVLISPYYSDSVSGKPREIDLVAEKRFPVIRDAFGTVKGDMSVQLYIECKFIKQTTVFWTHAQNTDATIDLLVTSTPLKRHNTYTNDHHYVRSTGGRVAKLFAGPSLAGTEGEQMFKALNQSLNAMIALRRTRSILPTDDRRNIRGTVGYPVIVCSNFEKFYSTDIEQDNDPEKISENFLLEVNYAYTNSEGSNLTEYFLVDILAFDWLHSFLGAIDEDVKAMAFMLSH